MLYLLIMVTGDILLPFPTLSPVIGVIGLLIMALYVRPTMMVIWSIIYTIVVILSLLHPSFSMIVNNGIAPSHPLTPYVRASTFMVSAALADGLCIFLNKLRVMFLEEREIINRFPLPVVVSDANGKIRYVNQLASSLLNFDSQIPVNQSFFDLFSPCDKRGATIAEYLHRVESGNPNKPLLLEFNRAPIFGHTQRMSAGSPKLLLTILSYSEKIVSPQKIVA
jgi:PAS domain-containing protein